MSNNIVETLIGAVVLAVAGVFLSYAFSQTGAGNVSGYQLLAQFDRADGINVGSDVRLSGIKVGTVVKQELSPSDFRAQVYLSIRPDIKLPDDSSAKIASEGLLGGNYIALSPGGSPDALENGGEIEFTQGAIDLLDIIGRAMFNSATTPGAKDEGGN